VKDLKGFRTWLEEAALTPEALEWVDTLSHEELAAMMRYMRLQGVAFRDGRPIVDGNAVWAALDEAMVLVHAAREERA